MITMTSSVHGMPSWIDLATPDPAGAASSIMAPAS